MKRGDWQKLRPGDLIRYGHALAIIRAVKERPDQINTIDAKWVTKVYLNIGFKPKQIQSYPSYDLATDLTDEEQALVMRYNLGEDR